MKHILTALFILMAIVAKGQNYEQLKEIGSSDTVVPGQAVIYGNFIQRLGFSSGGFPQDIRIVNVDTKETFAFRVKPTFKSAKENTFTYALEPGTYAILNYWWTQSKWYGGKIFTEPIIKGVDATDDLNKMVSSGEINPNEIKYYTFTVEPNTVNYLGTWHFDTGLVSFTDDKTQFDELIKDKYKRLDLSTAKTVLPN